MDNYVESMIKEHEKSLDKTAQRIVKTLLINSETLGQFNKEIDEVVKDLQYKGKHPHLIKRIKDIVKDKTATIKINVSKQQEYTNEEIIERITKAMRRAMQ